MNKTGYEILRLITEVRSEVPLITLPVLCVHGCEDTICLERGALQFMETVGTASTSKQLQLYPGAKHELFHEVEPTAGDSIQRVVSYFQSFLSEHTVAAAAFGVGQPTD